MNEKWKKLTVKTERMKINDELEIDVSGLSFKELGGLAEFQERKDFTGAMSYILFATIRKAVPVDGPDGMTAEEVQNVVDTISGDAGAKIVQKVQELTGLGTSEKK